MTILLFLGNIPWKWTLIPMNYQTFAFFFSAHPASKNKKGKLDLLFLTEHTFGNTIKKLIYTRSLFFEIKKNKVRQAKEKVFCKKSWFFIKCLSWLFALLYFFFGGGFRVTSQGSILWCHLLWCWYLKGWF